ncbi:MAG: hypothetical protein AAB846_02300 [Patescibacteria group bacterium]
MSDQKREKITVFWAVIGALVLIFLFLGTSFRTVDGPVKMTIDFGDGGVRTFEAPPQEDESAWDFLQQVSAQYGIPLEAAAGFSAQVIGEKRSGEGGKWVWYKNGRRQQESPIARELEAGEHVVFRFE